MRNSFFILMTTILFVLPACKEKDPTAPSDDIEHEVITSVTLVLRDSVTSAVRTASWRDADGPGGAAPVADTLFLAAGRTYLGSILLLNESVTPTDTLNVEIEEQANQHQFFYTPTGGISSLVGIERTDRDTNTPSLPVGLQFKLRTSGGGPSTGGLGIVLSHYDGIPKTATPGPESDIDIVLVTRVQ
ncbi:MAG: hypothetical protein MUE68_00515 [Bacteroidetes bacterium]|jgi:hypothetical protein|nr:hypothetical protein [Bacteroidota bacterium]